MKKRKTFSGRPTYYPSNLICIQYHKKIGIGHVGEWHLILYPIHSFNSQDLVWLGCHKNKQVRVTVPRHSDSSRVKIEGNFPFEHHKGRGLTDKQLRDEIDRILQQLK
jgi:hypothetical protein